MVGELRNISLRLLQPRAHGVGRHDDVENLIRLDMMNV
jgi:hypothetical protein